MKTVLEAISSRKTDFATHPFFRRLETSNDGHHSTSIVPGLMFWVMAFQDILRLNEARVVSPAMRKIARHHRYEDKGHEVWFFEDMALLRVERDVPWLFGPNHAGTRDAAYSLVSEVFRAEDDPARIALLLTLEAAGDVFFSRAPAYFRRSEMSTGLQYFSEKHYAVEKNHEMFERRMLLELEAIPLSEGTRKSCMELIERSFTAFDHIMTELETRVGRSITVGSSVYPTADIAKTG